MKYNIFGLIDFEYVCKNNRSLKTMGKEILNVTYVAKLYLFIAL
jgi:hypothetical protein